MLYAFHKDKRKQDTKRLIKALIPRVVFLAWRQIRYRTLFPDAVVSNNSRIHPAVHIGRGAVVTECDIGPDVIIGDFTTIGPRCRFAGKGFIRIGKFCSLAPEGFYWSENHRRAVALFPLELLYKGREEKFTELEGEDIIIGNDVWIGQRVSVLAGARIGDGCIVAAGAVVTRGDYPPYSLVAGVPARIIRPRLPEDRIKEVLEWRWWDKSPDEIFGPLMDKLHQTG